MSQSEVASLTINDVYEALESERRLNALLLQNLAESTAREGILRDTVKINHEWHMDFNTYPDDGGDDLSGLLDCNLKAVALPDDDTALRIVLQQRGDFVERIKQFNLMAGNTCDIFNVRQTGLYTGMQCEELSEKLSHIGLTTMAQQLDATGRAFKVGSFDKLIASSNPESILDDDVDLVVVTIGSLLSQGAGIQGAFSEVHRANMSKVWPDGTMHLDPNGKIEKPPKFVGPDLSIYVCPTRRD